MIDDVRPKIKSRDPKQAFRYFQDRISSYGSGWPETYVEQASFEISDLPASASPVVGPNMGATTPHQAFIFLKLHF